MCVIVHTICFFLSKICSFTLPFALLFAVRFVSSVLPPGSEDLKGNEVETIIAFKNALGLEDPDAAALHMEVFLN